MKTILCTGYIDTVEVNNIRQMAVDAMFSKPIDLSHFARTVRRVLDGDA